MKNILLVDDEPSILSAATRALSLQDIDIITARSGEDALQVFTRQEIAVLVADNQMPGMSGMELLGRVRQLSPATVRIIITASAELTSLLEAVNKGEIFHFIVKPWGESELADRINVALKQYQANLNHQAKKARVMRALAQKIESRDQYTNGHCERVARYAVEISQAIGLPKDQINDIRYGAWFHDCGKIGLHEDILNHPGRIGPQQMAEIKKHPDAGAMVVERAALPQRVVNIVRFHHERVDGKGYPLGLKGVNIPLEARIVSIADVYDALSSGRPYRKACSAPEINQIMKGYRGTALDENLLDLFMARISNRDSGR